MALKAEVKTEYPGIVSVRAIESRDGLLRERSACGFFGVKRYPGDIFQINKPEEFSPRWMEFVDKDAIPDGWEQAIAQREAARSDRLREKAELDSKTDSQRHAEAVKLAVEQTIVSLAGAQALKSKAIPSHEINYADGEMKRKPGRPKLNLEINEGT
jgi:hypothetical protein